MRIKRSVVRDDATFQRLALVHAASWILVHVAQWLVPNFLCAEISSSPESGVAGYCRPCLRNWCLCSKEYCSVLFCLSFGWLHRPMAWCAQGRWRLNCLPSFVQSNMRCHAEPIDKCEETLIVASLTAMLDFGHPLALYVYVSICTLVL